MQQPDGVAAIFADAQTLYAEAVEILEMAKRRIAAEAAWGATKRATDALILARTGREPTGTGQTTRRLGYLGRIHPELSILVLQYNARIVDLHGRCPCLGVCNEVNDLIRGTTDFIRTAEQLAAAGAGGAC